MWLNVSVLSTEKLAGSFNSYILDNVNALTAAIISLARISLSILISKHRTHCRHNGR